MKLKDIAQAKDPDLRASLTALKRASARARQEAIQTDTDFVIVEEGKLVVIEAKTLREQAEKESASRP